VNWIRRTPQPPSTSPADQGREGATRWSLRPAIAVCVPESECSQRVERFDPGAAVG
jgi:hypothetical protein